MLVRTTYLRLHEDHRGERARARTAKALREGLSTLPRVRGTEVGLALDPAARKGWDLFVHLRFDSLDDVHAHDEAVATQAVWTSMEAQIAFEKTWLWELA